MKKLLTLAIASILLFSCSTKTHKESDKTASDDVNVARVLENEEQDDHGSNIWVGEITEENFQKEPYNQWYSENYDMFTVNQAIVDEFKDELQAYDITVFMGTWCPDSQALTPEFFKVMDAAEYSDSKINMFAVDRSKKALNGEEEGLDIAYVPTIIFYKDGVEVNRIVESSINTLEEDIRDIVLGKEYTPNYAN